MTALTEQDQKFIDRARDMGPALRASTSDRDRLAGWLLAGLADLAERLGGGALSSRAGFDSLPPLPGHECSDACAEVGG